MNEMVRKGLDQSNWFFWEKAAIDALEVYKKVDGG